MDSNRRGGTIWVSATQCRSSWQLHMQHEKSIQFLAPEAPFLFVQHPQKKTGGCCSKIKGIGCSPLQLDRRCSSQVQLRRWLGSCGNIDFQDIINNKMDSDGLIRDKAAEVIGIVQSFDGSSICDLNSIRSPNCTIITEGPRCSPCAELRSNYLLKRCGQQQAQQPKKQSQQQQQTQQPSESTATSIGKSTTSVRTFIRFAICCNGIVEFWIRHWTKPLAMMTGLLLPMLM